MNKYTGLICPFCEKPFEDGDDIVVCPDCGAPSHRSCYFENKKCFYHAKHKEGYVWEMPASFRKAEAENSSNIVCSHCNNINSPRAETCSACGAPIKSLNSSAATDNSFAPKKDEETISGITLTELAAYMGTNTNYFIRSFRALIHAPMQMSWNLAAFFFTYFYFIYRKQYKIGAILMVISAFMAIPTLIYSAELFKAMAPEYLGVTIPFDEALMESMLLMSSKIRYLDIILRIACGMFANKLILQNAITKISLLRMQSGSNADSRTYLSYLFYKGNPNRVAVVAILGAYLVAYFIFAGYLTSLALPLLPPM